jgi:hypothetical protein
MSRPKRSFMSIDSRRRSARPWARRRVGCQTRACRPAGRPSHLARASGAFMLVGAIVAAGCSSTTPSQSASSAIANPTSLQTVATPSVSCGDLITADCAGATNVALAAVSDYGTPAIVELQSGVFCPTQGLLFAGTTCPGGSLPPPEGGRWLGSALITFRGTTAQAYVNISLNSGVVGAHVIALASPPP